MMDRISSKIIEVPALQLKHTVITTAKLETNKNEINCAVQKEQYIMQKTLFTSLLNCQNNVNLSYVLCIVVCPSIRFYCIIEFFDDEINFSVTSSNSCLVIALQNLAGARLVNLSFLTFIFFISLRHHTLCVLIYYDQHTSVLIVLPNTMFGFHSLVTITF